MIEQDRFYEPEEIQIASCPTCNWEGDPIDCSLEHFGAYIGEEYQPHEEWGWEEWDDLVCPECNTIVEITEIL